MEKYLRFQDVNYNQVVYPLSRLLGFSRKSTDCGKCLFLHFEPLRVTTQVEADTGAEDFNTDHVRIKFSDANVLRQAVKNLLTNIAASKTGYIEVLCLNGNSLESQAFDVKGFNISQYLCAPEGYGSALDGCAGASWDELIKIHIVEDA
jgi:hypothetical protein